MTRRSTSSAKNRYAAIALVTALSVLILSMLLTGVLLLTGGSLPPVVDLPMIDNAGSIPQIIAAATPATPTSTPTDAPTPTITPTPTETSTPTITPTPAVRTVVNTSLLNVRAGPDTVYPILTEAVLGDAFTVLGRNEDGTWLRVCCVQSTQESWVATEFMALDAPIDTLPILETPEPPATPSAEENRSVAPSSPVVGLPGSGGFGGPGDVNPLTGQSLPAERRTQRPVIVCVNNDIAARPQLGFSRADIVYEYLMEGFGITRFSAIFYGQESETIGPVRSARLINFYLGALYDAGLACSGASDQVRFALKNDAPFPYLDIDLDDPSNSRYSVSVGSDYRTRLRTSTAGLRKWLADWGVERAPSLRGFTFGGVPDGGAPATLVNIPYPTFTGSQVSYRYDPGSGRYLRFLGGEPHLDGNSRQQLAVDNVIIQVVPHEVTDIVEDSLGSRSIRLNLFGSGKAIVVRNGLAFEGIWRSQTRGDLPRFFDLSGNEIPLQAGKTWISVVPETYVVPYQ
ncbi:MAG: DUF3048 domain-containing protein [Caldilineaceae bacterium]|nr:DUF3048 domain-containing protein [Caldilineaceae bacterium]